MCADILDYVEGKTASVVADLGEDSRDANGQFMTPASIARFMAGMFAPREIEEVGLLDPGAGTGSLCAAFLDEW